MADERKDEQKNSDEPDPLDSAIGGLIPRRQVYYRRLVGDNLFGAQKHVSTAKTGKEQVMFFIVYFFLALVVIMQRASILSQFELNSALDTVLKESAFQSSPRLVFEDIRTVENAVTWLTDAVLPMLCTGRECASSECRSRSLPFSLIGFNRILPAEYEGDGARIRLTVRKMNTKGDPEVAVGRRFTEFVESVWSDFALSGDFPTSESEETDTIETDFIYKGYPSEFFNDAENRPAEVGDAIPVNWQHCGDDCGYKNNGGYVMDIVINPTAAQQLTLDTDSGEEQHAAAILAEDDDAREEAAERLAKTQINFELARSEIVAHQSVYLHRSGDDDPNIKPSGGDMGLGLLQTPGVLDSSVSFIGVEMVTYNANRQTMSTIRIPFTWNAAGYLQDKRIIVDTVKIDGVQDSVLEFFGTIYLVITAGDLLFRFWQLSQDPKKVLKDIWSILDIAAGICNVASIMLWRQYEGKITNWIASEVVLPDLSVLDDRVSDFLWYTRISSFATLTVAIRIIKLLGNSSSRVKLLQHTLGLAAYPLVLYLAYIGVAFLGFMNLAQLNFGTISPEFFSIARTFVSCFSMFMGQVWPIDTVQGSVMKPYFFVPFMMFFFFISVQMFNSIINYAYNLSREEMHKELEKEKEESKARKQAQAGRPSALSICMKRMCSCFVNPQKEFAKKQAALSGKPAETGHKGPSLDGLDGKVREKVEEFLKAEKDQKKGDSAVGVILFMLFAAAYIWFLSLNLAVGGSYQLKSRVDDAVITATVMAQQVDGEFTPIQFHDIRTMDELDLWLTRGLPDTIFRSAGSAMANETNTDFSGTVEPVIPHENYCLGGWSCLLMRDGTLMRLTQRKVPMTINTNAQGAALVPYRINDYIASANIVDTSIETSDDLWMQSVEGCAFRVQDFGGFSNLGGYECMLASTKAGFEDQMKQWRSSYALSLESQIITIEFIVYNGNVDMLTHTRVELKVAPSGMVTPSVQSFALRFVSLTEGEGSVALIPLIIYSLMVIYYTYQEVNAIYLEFIKQSANNPGDAEAKIIFDVIKTRYEDPYNVSDISSIVLSLTSLILFVRVTLQTNRFDTVIEENPFPDFITYVYGITDSQALYIRLSSINVIVIFFRFVKLFRENPRMNKLSATLALARPDIAWFLVMLFVTLIGFVTFGHVSFGAKLKGLSTPVESFRYCFVMIIGEFAYWELEAIDPLMSYVFFFCFIIIFNCMFVNIFFAIIDSFFVTATPPALNLRTYLKPYLGCVWCIQWDHDIAMEKIAGHDEDKNKPPSRSDAARNANDEIQSMWDLFHKQEPDDRKKIDCKMIGDKSICDTKSDPRFKEVEAWARDEARKYRERLERLREHRNSHIRTEHDKDNEERKLRQELEQEADKKNRSERQMRYQLQIHEKSAQADLATVAQYTLLLEHKIARKSQKMLRLQKEMDFMQREMMLLSYTEEEIEEYQRMLSSGVGQAGKPVMDEEEAEEDEKVEAGGEEVEELKPLITEPDGLVHGGESADQTRDRKAFMDAMETLDATGE